MHDINTTWCHGCTKIIRCQHCTLRCFSPLFSPIWFTFIIYETCLTNPQQRFQIMIGICQCRIVFLKTITTVPGNVNMSIEGNTSLNKPIFCKNKTKSKKKKKHNTNQTTQPKKNMHRKRKFELHRTLLLQCWAEKFILPARWWRQKNTFVFPNCQSWNTQYLST